MGCNQSCSRAGCVQPGCATIVFCQPDQNQPEQSTRAINQRRSNVNETVLFQGRAGFEAAREVGILPAGHRGGRLHGHSFVARVRAALPAGFGGFAGAEVDAITAELAAAVAPLDYRYLNETLAVPTDENLLRWIRDRLDVPGLLNIGLASTSEQGVDLDEAGDAHLWHRFRFEAAHQLPNVPAGHQCGRMHGHGFEVILHANMTIADADMGLDYDLLAELWRPLQGELQHACLNDIAGLENPTSEMLAAWLWERLKPELSAISWITVYETATAGCHFDGRHYRIWKERRFESALALPGAPAGDPRRGLHGHSYLARLHLSAPLDKVLGWTVDYGDVKAAFQPAYRKLDHHRLDDIDSLESADCASVARWIRGQVLPELPQLDRVDLFERPGCGCLLAWGELGPALPA